MLVYVVGGFMIFWYPLEFFRIKYGYSGNISETFPELIAFQIFTAFFVLPLSFAPLALWQIGFFPHERVTIFINLLFVIVELIVSTVVVRSFLRTQSASFYLRTAPLIDKLFKRIYGTNDACTHTKRSLQIGMKKYDK